MITCDYWDQVRLQSFEHLILRILTISERAAHAVYPRDERSFSKKKDAIDEADAKAIAWVSHSHFERNVIALRVRVQLTSVSFLLSPSRVARKTSLSCWRHSKLKRCRSPRSRHENA